MAVTRARNLNAEDPYVTMRCGDELATFTETDDGWLMYRCEDGSVPMGQRDIVRALADEDEYTQRVCSMTAYRKVFNPLTVGHFIKCKSFLRSPGRWGAIQFVQQCYNASGLMIMQRIVDRL